MCCLRPGRTYASLGAGVALGVDPDVFGNDDALLVESRVVVDLRVVVRQCCAPCYVLQCRSVLTISVRETEASVVACAQKLLTRGAAGAETLEVRYHGCGVAAVAAVNLGYLWWRGEDGARCLAFGRECHNKTRKSIGDGRADLESCEGVTFQRRDRGNFIGGESEGGQPTGAPRMGWRGRGAHSQTIRGLCFCLWPSPVPDGLNTRRAPWNPSPSPAPARRQSRFPRDGCVQQMPPPGAPGAHTCSPMRGFRVLSRKVLLATISGPPAPPIDPDTPLCDRPRPRTCYRQHLIRPPARLA